MVRRLHGRRAGGHRIADLITYGCPGRRAREYTQGVPWVPDLFSARALERLLEKRRRAEVVAVPFFDGLLSGELDALLESFAGEPLLHHPVLGRIRGRQAFEAYVAEMNVWFAEHEVSIEDGGHVVLETCGFEEVVLHIDGGAVALPLAIVADHPHDGRLTELRIYYSSWPVTGRHAVRPPLLQSDSTVHTSGVIADYQSALAAGDVDAIVSTFEADGYAREPAGDPYRHSGTRDLRAFYEQLFSNGGGIPLEHCGVVDDGHTCALEYNVTRWGKTDLPPQAGVAVYARGLSGKLAAARIYDDVDPPL